MQTLCANCQTANGPFDRARVGKPICKNSLEGCNKRRATLDRKRWDLNKGEVHIKNEDT
jgi:hypothetical protein